MRLHYRISWIFLNMLERVVFGFAVSGRHFIPETGPVIIASNHISYCDPPVVGSGVPREVYFLAKEELFRSPAFGWLISRYNAIPLKRAVGDVGAVRKALTLLRQGRAVLMFPEGTRSLSGRLLKPKPGVGMIACLAAAPVVPAYVTGTSRLGSALLRRAKLAVAFGEPIMPGLGGQADGPVVAGAGEAAATDGRARPEADAAGRKAGAPAGEASGDATLRTTAQDRRRYQELSEEVMRRIACLATEIG